MDFDYESVEHYPITLIGFTFVSRVRFSLSLLKFNVALTQKRQGVHLLSIHVHAAPLQTC